MYQIVILLVFSCPSNAIQTKEYTYKPKEYAKATNDLTKWYDKLNDHYTEVFDGETCELSKVVPGNRRK